MVKIQTAISHKLDVLAADVSKKKGNFVHIFKLFHSINRERFLTRVGSCLTRKYCSSFTNTLAYFRPAKSNRNVSTTLTPGPNVMKLFTAVIY